MSIYCPGCSQRITDAALCRCVKPACWVCHDSGDHGEENAA